jgi:hypothetical protein
MSHARRRKPKPEPPTMSDNEKKLAATAHRRGMPTFLLRLQGDYTGSAKAAAWRPAYRHD